MKLCTTCGNEIEDHINVCPYCERQQIGGGKTARRRKAAALMTLNLKKGMPTVQEALLRFDQQVASAQMRGVKLIRVIHGWGSGGEGGKIRTALLQHLRRVRSVRSFVNGEGYADTTNEGRRLLSAFPELKGTLTPDSRNPGITFVEIG